MVLLRRRDERLPTRTPRGWAAPQRAPFFTQQTPPAGPGPLFRLRILGAAVMARVVVRVPLLRGLGGCARWKVYDSREEAGLFERLPTYPFFLPIPDKTSQHELNC